MPHSVDDLISLINEELRRWASPGDRMAVARHAGLVRLRDVLRSTGFPTDRDELRALSLVPIVFQEANYEDIEWTDRAAPLEHLSGILAIDVAAQSGGRQHHDLTDGEYSEYVRASLAAIRDRQGRSPS